MMNDLYLWLQDEVKVKDLNEYLYQRDLDRRFDKQEEFSKIKTWIDIICDKESDMDRIIKQYAISVEFRDEQKLPFIHAQMIEENGNITIWIQNCWIKKYQQYMESQQAVLVHLAHEIYHVIEENEKPWYFSYAYKKRQSVSEVCAMYYSQRIAGLDYHPKLYEIACELNESKYSREEITSTLKQLKRG